MTNLPGRLDRLNRRVPAPESAVVFQLWVSVPGSAGLVECQATGERLTQEELRRLPGYFTLKIGDTEIHV